MIYQAAKGLKSLKILLFFGRSRCENGYFLFAFFNKTSAILGHIGDDKVAVKIVAVIKLAVFHLSEYINTYGDYC